MTENVENFENSFTKTIAEQSVSSQTLLGAVMELADCKGKFEHALHCRTVCSLTPGK
jgi:hypothetical protein